MNLPSLNTLKGTIISFDEKQGCGVISFDTDESFCNPLGTIQGGILSAMLDEVCGLTCYQAAKRAFTTGTLHTDFIKAAKVGDRLRAEGKVVRIGKRQAIVDGLLYRDSDDILIARATCHQIFLDTEIKKS